MAPHPATVGGYPVEGELGRGGMGVVYLARDVRLDRPVAIKVLSAAFASAPEYLARFDREAKLLASLNHPNIGAIYAVETVVDAAGGSQPVLVLEYVPGDTLADRIRRNPPSIRESLDWCHRIAMALEAAHDRGIVHRDLKPGNVKVTANGEVKVLDFGLARGGAAATEDVARSPTVTYGLTAAGVLLGTAAYMSPEQARGQPVDKRTDIWSFGCVLYECLTGRRSFTGETIFDTIGHILERDVDWSALPPATPPAVRDLLRHCLEKDVRKRQRDIGDARIELEDILAGRSSGTNLVAVRTGGDTSTARRPWRQIALTATLVAMGIAAGAILAKVGTRPSSAVPDSGGPKRLSVVVPPSIRAADVGMLPDGRLAIVGFVKKPDGTEDARARMFVRRLDEPAFTPVPGTEGMTTDRDTGATSYAASADGTWLAVVSTVSEQSSQRQVIKVRADGTTVPVTVTKWNDGWAPWFTWMPGGDLVLSAFEKGGWTLVRVPLDSTPVKPGVKLDVGGLIGIPRVGRPLPDGRSVFLLVQRIGARGYQADTWIADTTTGKATLVVEDAGNARYLPTGHIVFTRRNTLMAAPFDLTSGRISGDLVGLDAGLRTPTVWAPAPFDVSNSGDLTYVPGGQAGGDRRISIVSTSGQVTAASDERRPFERGLIVSPGGRRASVVVTNTSGTFETWVFDLDRASFRPAIAVPRVDSTEAIWSPKGDLVAFFRNAFGPDDGIHVMRGNGPSKAVFRLDLRNDPPVLALPSSWAPDGSGLIVTRMQGGRADLLFLPISVNGDPGALRKLAAEPEVDEGGARFSPDGQLVAFVSNETGRPEVYVAAYQKDGPLGPRLRVSKGPAPSTARVVVYLTTPLAWAGDSRRLFYGADVDKIMMVRVHTTPMLRSDQPEVVYDLRQLRVASDVGSQWDILPDGRLIAIQKGLGEQDVSSFSIVLNWIDEVRRRLPAR